LAAIASRALAVDGAQGLFGAVAARVTALPDGLRARDFRIVLPVQFSLENDR